MARYRNRKEAMQVRTEACRMAATVLAGRPDLDIHPKAWSLTVFFEAYISEGSSATMKMFGPKKPVKLRIASKG
jgi:hypothetical protein